MTRCARRRTRWRGSAPLLPANPGRGGVRRTEPGGRHTQRSAGDERKRSGPGHGRHSGRAGDRVRRRADQVPVEVQVVMSDRTLFGFEDRPATLAGYGPVPGAGAREWVLGLDARTRSWVRRLYVDATTGTLTALDSHRRLFRHSLRRALQIRDQWCRTPWCSAPLRHIDHPIPVADGGETSTSNGQGLCEACNYAKESHGWRARPAPRGRRRGRGDADHAPTGHTYVSRPPPILLRDEISVPRRRSPRTIDIYWTPSSDYHAA